MKVVVIEQEGQPPLQDGWVRGLGALFTKQAIVWRCIVRADEQVPAHGQAKIRLSRKDRAFLRPFGETRGWEAERDMGQDEDVRLEIPVSAWAFSRLKIEVWQEKALGDRQSQTIYLLPKRYQWLAYGSVLLAGVVPLVLLRAWRYADDAIYLRETPISNSVIGLLSVFGISLTSLVGGTFLEFVLRAAGMAREAAKAGPFSLLLRRPLLLASSALLLGLLVLPLGFVRVCDHTGGQPRIQGYGAPLQAKEQCVLLWSPLSTPKPESSSFRLAEESGTGDDRSWLHALHGLQTWNIECKNSSWCNLPLKEQACTVSTDQDFDGVPKGCSTDGGAPDGGAGMVELTEKPFEGKAVFHYGDKGNLTCSVPAKTALQVFTLNEGQGRGASSTGLVREVQVECRQGKIDYDLVSNAQSPDADGKNDHAIQICVPRNATDCRMTLNAAEDAIVSLPAELLEGRRTTIEGATCAVGYDPKTYGGARVAQMSVEARGEVELIIKAGVCTTRWSSAKAKEFKVILTQEELIHWSLSKAPIGTTFSFPKGLLDRREINITSDKTRANKITCPAGADTLVLLEAKDLGSESVTLDKASETIPMGTMNRDKTDPLWLCVDKKLLLSSPAGDKANMPKTERQMQCNPKGDKAARSGTSVWIDFNNFMLLRCADLVESCCFVCPQTLYNASASPIRKIAPCARTPAVDPPFADDLNRCQRLAVKPLPTCP